MFKHTSYDNFKYHVSCTDGKISVRINLLLYLFFHPRRPNQHLSVSYPVGLSLLIQHFHAIRPVENVVFLQERNTQMLHETRVEK